MDIQELVVKNRSYRRFYEDEKIEKERLYELIELARITPSAANKQPLKYLLSNTPELNAKIFSTLGWAASLPDWPGPEEGERPSAYIVILGDTRIAKSWSVDPGIVMQTMLLGAVEMGLGGCMFGSVKRTKLAGLLRLPGYFEVLYVLALGRPREKVVLEPLGEDGDTRYYRDENQVHHVPKRALDELIIQESSDQGQ
ncbi:MAG: nitroreductase [Spirochaetes bacterium]|nr:MAG: nitroreductase [Spirochaetota bacterium]